MQLRVWGTVSFNSYLYLPRTLGDSSYQGALRIHIGNKVTRLNKKCTKACRFGGVKPVGSSYDTIYVCRGTETNEKLIRRVCYRNFAHRSERRVVMWQTGGSGRDMRSRSPPKCSVTWLAEEMRLMTKEERLRMGLGHTVMVKYHIIGWTIKTRRSVFIIRTAQKYLFYIEPNQKQLFNCLTLSYAVILH